MIDELLVSIIFFIVLGICILNYRKSTIQYEGFVNEQPAQGVTDSVSDISGVQRIAAYGCTGIPLSDFNTELVLSYIPPDIAYAIMSYSTGGYNYLPTIKKAFKDADTSRQMAMSALLGRYLAFNGGSAAIPGPGYGNTSPGNYVAQMKGATDILIPINVDTSLPVYGSFRAATAVALCPALNKGWVSTADF